MEDEKLGIAEWMSYEEWQNCFDAELVDYDTQDLQENFSSEARLKTVLYI